MKKLNNVAFKLKYEIRDEVWKILYEKVSHFGFGLTDQEHYYNLLHEIRFHILKNISN